MKADVTRKTASVEMIRTLVGYPTVSRDSNLELIHYVGDYLKPLGADIRMTFDDARRKANIVATFGAGEGGVMLSGHTDVVPVDGQPWDTDPFSLQEVDGRLFGRGTADMKSFIACALAVLPEILERGLRTPLHLAFSYDEEVGCIGVGRLIEDLAQAGIRPRSCIVGEPTLMRPVIAHKGKKSYRCRVKGAAGHSAYAPYCVNAVEYAAEAVSFLKNMARRHRDRGPYDRAFDVAHTTVHTGVMRGGSALNVVPNECVFDFEFRHLPGDEPDQLLDEFTRYLKSSLEPEMHKVDPVTGFKVEEMSGIPMLDTPVESEVVALAQELAGTNDFGKVSFGTEASQFQRAGIPTVVCGPGSIEQAHKPNEFVTLEQVAKCEAFLRRLADRICRN